MAMNITRPLELVVQWCRGTCVECRTKNPGIIHSHTVRFVALAHFGLTSCFSDDVAPLVRKSREREIRATLRGDVALRR